MIKGHGILVHHFTAIDASDIDIHEKSFIRKFEVFSTQVSSKECKTSAAKWSTVRLLSRQAPPRGSDISYVATVLMRSFCFYVQHKVLF